MKREKIVSAVARNEIEIPRWFDTSMRPSCDCVRRVREVRVENGAISCLACGGVLVPVRRVAA